MDKPMNNTVAGMNKTNLATLTLCLYEDLEAQCAKSNYRLKPRLSENAFETCVVSAEGIYFALCAAISGLIGKFHKGKNDFIISDYQSGIMIEELETAENELNDLCTTTDNKWIVQKSKLGLALALLNYEGIKIKMVYGEEKSGIMFLMKAYPGGCDVMGK